MEEIFISQTYFVNISKQEDKSPTKWKWDFTDAYWAGWHNCNALDMYLEDTWSESQPRYWLSWFKFFMVFLSHSRQIPG